MDVEVGDIVNPGWNVALRIPINGHVVESRGPCFLRQFSTNSYPSIPFAGLFSGKPVRAVSVKVIPTEVGFALSSRKTQDRTAPLPRSSVSPMKRPVVCFVQKGQANAVWASKLTPRQTAAGFAVFKVFPPKTVSGRVVADATLPRYHTGIIMEGYF